MSPTDQLTRPERVRLEALAQAIASAAVIPLFAFEERGGAGVPASEKVEKLLARAEDIEQWLLSASPPQA